MFFSKSFFLFNLFVVFISDPQTAANAQSPLRCGILLRQPLRTLGVCDVYSLRLAKRTVFLDKNSLIRHISDALDIGKIQARYFLNKSRVMYYVNRFLKKAKRIHSRECLYIFRLRTTPESRSIARIIIIIIIVITSMIIVVVKIVRRARDRTVMLTMGLPFVRPREK